MLLPMDEKQFAFWKMRRSGTPNITIANLLGISRQAVSKALLVMDGKIESALREMAQSNQIAIDTINAERGSCSAGRYPSRPQQLSSSPKNTGSRYGTIMTATAARASGLLNASSCSGIMQPSSASGSRNPPTRQRWQKNFLRK